MFKFLQSYYCCNYRYDDNKEINIMTFGMYLGITYGKDYSQKNSIESRKFIDMIKDENHRIIVGLPPLIECKPDCYDCKKKYDNTIQRLHDTKKMLNLNMKFCKESHAKFYQLGNLMIAGGMNLSDSSWDDFMIVIKSDEDKHDLNLYFNKQWNKLK